MHNSERKIITAIEMSSAGQGLEHIAALKWHQPLGGDEWVTRQNAYDRVICWPGSVVASNNSGPEVQVIAEESFIGTPYVRTLPDASFQNNLLSLPLECRH